MKQKEKDSLFAYLTGEINAPNETIYLVDKDGIKTSYKIERNLLGLYTGTSVLNPFVTAKEELQLSAQLRGVSPDDMQEVSLKSSFALRKTLCRH